MDLTTREVLGKQPESINEIGTHDCPTTHFCLKSNWVKLNIRLFDLMSSSVNKVFIHFSFLLLVFSASYGEAADVKPNFFERYSADFYQDLPAQQIDRWIAQVGVGKPTESRVQSAEKLKTYLNSIDALIFTLDEIKSKSIPMPEKIAQAQALITEKIRPNGLSHADGVALIDSIKGKGGDGIEAVRVQAAQLAKTKTGHVMSLNWKSSKMPRMSKAKRKLRKFVNQFSAAANKERPEQLKDRRDTLAHLMSHTDAGQAVMAEQVKSKNAHLSQIEKKQGEIQRANAYIEKFKDNDPLNTIEPSKVTLKKFESELVQLKEQGRREFGLSDRQMDHPGQRLADNQNRKPQITDDGRKIADHPTPSGGDGAFLDSTPVGEKGKKTKHNPLVKVAGKIKDAFKSRVLKKTQPQKVQ